MTRIVIIGAGLTGLSAAYHLEKNGFHDYVLFEQKKNLVAYVVQLCRTVLHLIIRAIYCMLMILIFNNLLEPL